MDRKALSYTVIEASFLAGWETGLEEQVLRHLASGWTLHGPLIVIWTEDGPRFYREMVRLAEGDLG